jgi:hypothetical protein
MIIKEIKNISTSNSAWQSSYVWYLTENGIILTNNSSAKKALVGSQVPNVVGNSQ